MDLKPTGGKNGRSGNESEKVSEWARQDFLLCVPLQERRSRESDFKLTESTCISYPLHEAEVHIRMDALETVGKVKFAGKHHSVAKQAAEKGGAKGESPAKSPSGAKARMILLALCGG
jgi:hypothetical protein